MLITTLMMMMMMMMITTVPMVVMIMTTETIAATCVLNKTSGMLLLRNVRVFNPRRISQREKYITRENQQHQHQTFENVDPGLISF